MVQLCHILGVLLNKKVGWSETSCPTLSFPKNSKKTKFFFRLDLGEKFFFVTELRILVTQLRDFGDSIKDFGHSIKDFGHSIKDFGDSIKDFGHSIKDFG